MRLVWRRVALLEPMGEGCEKSRIAAGEPNRAANKSPTDPARHCGSFHVRLEDRLSIRQPHFIILFQAQENTPQGGRPVGRADHKGVDSDDHRCRLSRGTGQQASARRLPVSPKLAGRVCVSLKIRRRP